MRSATARRRGTSVGDAMGLFRKPRVDPLEMERIKEQVRHMREHLDKAKGNREDVSARLDSIESTNSATHEQVASFNELAGRLSNLGDRLESADTSASMQPGIDDLTKRLDDVAAQLTDWSTQHEQLRTQLTALDERITSVSTELANQITELGNDIETLTSRTPDGDEPDPARTNELRSGQERLANEQARYQIAFREDLARLAEQLRRASR